MHTYTIAEETQTTGSCYVFFCFFFSILFHNDCRKTELEFILRISHFNCKHPKLIEHDFIKISFHIIKPMQIDFHHFKSANKKKSPKRNPWFFAL